MIGLESALATLSKTVATKAASYWLNDRSQKNERSRDLNDLVAIRSRDRFMKKSLERQIEAMVDEVARRLEPFHRTALGGMPENERVAATIALNDIFASANLSDDSFFAIDADAVKLVRSLRHVIDERRSRVGLSADADRYMEMMIAECCDCYVRIIVSLKAFPPRALAESLGRLSSIGDAVADCLARIPVRSLDAPTGSDLDEEFRQRYLEHISNSYDKTEMFGVDMPYKMISRLSVAYLSMSAARESHVTSRGGARVDSATHLVRVEEILDGSPRVLLRGDAGSGKTTLLKWLAVSAARGTLTGHLAKYNGSTPFLIPLRRFAETDLPAPEQILDKSAAMIAGLEPDGWARRQLANTRALVLIDGIDEVAAAQRVQVRDWLDDLCNHFPDCRYVVTTRPAAAPPEWLHDFGFKAAKLESMSVTDVRKFVVQWHDAARGAIALPCDIGELPRLQSQLLARLNGNIRLRLLATTPLLCAMLCALNIGHGGQLPRNRMELYDSALRMLLQRREAERDAGTSPLAPGFLQFLDIPQQRILLRDIAWRLAVKEEAQASKDRVLEWMERKLSSLVLPVPPSQMDVRAALVHLLERSGILREPTPGYIDFIHKTFLEYLAAEEAAAQDYVDLLVEHAHMDAWQEITVLAAGHANARLTKELLRGLLKKNERGKPEARSQLPGLLMRCMETVTDAPVELRAGLEKQARKLIPPKDREHALHVSAGGAAVLPYFPQGTASLTEGSAAATVTAVAMINGPAALDKLEAYSVDGRPRVRDAILDAWSLFDPEEYAKRVLNDGLAVNGHIEITSPRQAESARARFPDASLRLLTDEIGFRSLSDYPSIAAIQVFGPVADLSPLTEQPNIEHIWFSDLSRVDYYSPLSGLIRLRSLTLLGARSLIHLGHVSDRAPLEFLAVQGVTNAVNLIPLKKFPNLTVVLDNSIVVMNGQDVNFERKDLSWECSLAYPRHF